MNSKHDLEKKRKTFNIPGVILGIGSLVLPVYLGVVFYNRGIYIDEHSMGGYITEMETVAIILIPLLLLASIICFKIAQSHK